MPTIDNKVVQMTFDNKQFEQGAKQSMKTLEELKKALELDKAVDSLQNLEKAANNFDISSMAKSIDEISDRFTLMGRIGQKVFDEIAGTVVGTAKKVTDTIVSMPKIGWSKYEAQTKAVQTIQSSLPDKPLEEIKAVLGDLIEYTDLTSYDFATMATTLGKFTSIGVDLGVAEKAIEGIANEAASAGGEISQANTAMYNFAQAMAAGSMKVTDWVSINKTASLGTKEFKERVIETAIGLGKLKRVGENVGATSKGLAVDFQSFESTLRYGWFDRDVMLAVLNEYADRTQGVGQKAFEAASKAITFGQAMEAVKDAISTGWMNSFTYIFGDLEEATKLFSGINDALVELAEHFYLPRNEMLQMWHEGIDGMSGYKLAMEALVNIWDVFSNIIYKAQEAFAEIFGSVEDTAGAFINATASLRDFTVELRKYFGIFNKEDAEEAIDETIESVNEYAEALERGARGDSVRKMQEMLMGLGNDMIKLDKYGADGIFGPETERAVREFQKAFNLEENGVLDAATQQKLSEEFLPNAVKNIVSSFNKELEVGARGEDVKKMQQMLLDLGDDMVALDKYGADGIYGKETRRAVMDFQRSAGLMVTGIFDKDTQIALAKALYPEPGEKETIVEETVEEVDNLHRGLDGLKGILRGVAATAKIFVNIVRIGAGVVGGLLKAIIPVVAGVFAVGGAIGDAVAAFASFLDGVTNVEGWMTGFNILLAPITAGLNVLSEFLFGVADGITTIVSLAKEATSFENIGEMLFSMDPETNSYAYAIYNLMTQIKNVVDQARPYIQAFGAVMTVLLKHAYEWVGNKVNIVLEKLRTLLGDLWKRITEGKLVQKVLGGVLLVFRGLIGAVSTLVSWITSLGNAIWNGIKMVGSLIANSKVLQNIFGTVGDTVAPLKEQFDRLRDAFKNFTMIKFKNFDHFWKRFTEALSKSDLTKWLVKPLNKLKSLLSKPAKLFNNITKAIEKITSMSKKGMGLDAILETLKTNPEQNKTAIGLINFLLRIRNLIDSVISFGKKMGEGLQRNFGGVWDRIKSFSSSVWDSIKEFFTPSEGESFTEHIRGKIDEIRGKISEKWNEVVVWAQGIIDGSPFLSTVAGKVSSIWDGVLDFFTPAEGESFESSVDAKVKEAMAPVEDAFNYVKDTFEGGTAKAEMDRLIESGMDEESAARKSGYYRTLPAIIETIKTSFINAKNDIAKWWVEFKQSPIVAPVISFVESVWGDITKFFEPTEKDENIVDYIFNRIVQAKTGIRNASEEVKKFVAEVKKNPVVQAVINFASSAWGNIAEFFFPGEDGKGLVEHINDAINTIKNGIALAKINIALWWLQFKDAHPIASGIVGWAQSIWAGIVDFFVPNDGESFVQYITNRVDRIKTQLENVVGGVFEFFTGKDSKAHMEALVKGAGMDPKMAAKESGYTQTLPGIIDELRTQSTLFDGVVTILEGAWTGLKGIIDDVTTNVGAFFKYDPNSGETPVQQFLSRLGELSPIGTWFETFGNQISGGWSKVQEGLSGITDHKGGALGWLVEQVTNLIDQIDDSGINKLIDTLWDKSKKYIGWYLLFKGVQGLGGLSNIISNVVNAFGYNFYTKGNFMSNFGGMVNNLGNGFLKSGLGILSTAAGVFIFVEAIKHAVDLIKELGGDTELGVYTGILIAAITTILTGVSGLINAIGGTSIESTKGNFKFKIDGFLTTAVSLMIIIHALESLYSLINKENYDQNAMDKAVSTIKSLLKAVTIADVFSSLADNADKIIGVLKGSSFTANSFGTLVEGTGVVGIAYAVKIIVGSIKSFLDIINDLPIEEVTDEAGNKTTEKRWDLLDTAVRYVDGLVAVFTGSNIVTSIAELITKSKVKTNGAGGLNSLLEGSGVVAIAFSIGLVIDSISDMMDIVNSLPDVPDVDNPEQATKKFENLDHVIGKIEELIAVFTFSDLISSLKEIGTTVGGFMNITKFETSATGELAKATGIVGIVASVSWLVGSMADALVDIKDVDPHIIDSFGTTISGISNISVIFSSLSSMVTAATNAASPGTAIATGAEEVLSGLASFVGDGGLTVIIHAMSDAIKEIDDADPSVIEAFGDVIEKVNLYMAAFLGGNGAVGGLAAAFGPGGWAVAAGISLSELASSGAFSMMASGMSDIAMGLAEGIAALPTDIDVEKINAFGVVLTALSGALGNVRVEWLEHLFGGDDALSKMGPALIGFAESIAGKDGHSSLNDILKDFDFDDSQFEKMFDYLSKLVYLSSYLMTASAGSMTPTSIRFLGSEVSQFFLDMNEVTNEELTHVGQITDTIIGLFNAVETIDFSVLGMSIDFDMASGLRDYSYIVDDEARYSIITKLYSGLDEQTPQFYNIGANIDLGIAAGLFDYQGTSIVAAIAVAKACYDAACHFLGVNSPSREFAWIGQQLDAGLAKGLYDYASSSTDASSYVSSSILDTAKEGLSGFETAIFDQISDTPVISPVLDLSNVSSNASRIGGILGSHTLGVSMNPIASRIDVGSVASVRNGNTSNSDLAAAVDALNLRMDQLGNAIANMRVVTDTGAVIGAITSGVDERLGENQYYSSRGL